MSKTKLIKPKLTPIKLDESDDTNSNSNVNNLPKSMHLNELSIGTEKYTEEVDEYEYSYEEGCVCSICGGEYQKNYVTLLYSCEKKTKTCFLCNCIVNFKNFCMGKCFLILSDLTQQEINIKILKNYNENGNIPYPKNIDKKCKLINLSVYEFVHCYEQMSNDEKKLFDKFKISFTSNAVNSLASASANYFSTDTISSADVKKHDLAYFELESYDLTNKQKEIIDNKQKIVNDKRFNSINIIKKSLEEKILTATKITKFVGKLI